MIMKGPCRPDIDREVRQAQQWMMDQGGNLDILPCRYMLLTYLAATRLYPHWRQIDLLRLTAYAHDAPIQAVEAAVYIH